MLQIALTPALVALGEVDDIVRAFLERPADRRIELHLVARPGQQRRLDIIVAQDLAAERRTAAELGKSATLRKGGDAEDRVMPPVRAFPALQPGDATGVGRRI